MSSSELARTGPVGEKGLSSRRFSDDLRVDIFPLAFMGPAGEGQSDTSEPMRLGPLGVRQRTGKEAFEKRQQESKIIVKHWKTHEKCK